MSLFARNSASLPATAAPLSARVGAVLTGIGAAFTRWQKAREGRKALFALTQLDDHFLKDIGVTRADVDAALLSQVEADPSLVLGERRTSAHVATMAVKREAIAQSRKGF